MRVTERGNKSDGSSVCMERRKEGMRGREREDERETGRGEEGIQTDRGESNGAENTCVC